MQSWTPSVMARCSTVPSIICFFQFFHRQHSGSLVCWLPFEDAWLFCEGFGAFAGRLRWLLLHLHAEGFTKVETPFACSQIRIVSDQSEVVWAPIRPQSCWLGFEYACRVSRWNGWCLQELVWQVSSSTYVESPPNLKTRFLFNSVIPFHLGAFHTWIANTDIFLFNLIGQGLNVFFLGQHQAINLDNAWQWATNHWHRRFHCGSTRGVGSKLGDPNHK